MSKQKLIDPYKKEELREDLRSDYYNSLSTAASAGVMLSATFAAFASGNTVLGIAGGVVTCTMAGAIAAVRKRMNKNLSAVSYDPSEPQI